MPVVGDRWQGTLEERSPLAGSLDLGREKKPERDEAATLSSQGMGSFSVCCLI